MPHNVMPAQAGIQAGYRKSDGMDSRLRGNDTKFVMPARFQRASWQDIEKATTWIPACAGMTQNSSCPRVFSGHPGRIVQKRQHGLPLARE
jgi:hypothetical protein